MTIGKYSTPVDDDLERHVFNVLDIIWDTGAVNMYNMYNMVYVIANTIGYGANYYLTRELLSAWMGNYDSRHGIAKP